MSTVAPPLDIRLALPADYEEAGRVTADAYRASYDDLPEPYVDSLRDVASRAGAGDVWVAVDAAGIIAGTVWIASAGRPLSPVAEPGETDFRQLAVAPHARGRGVGEALTRHVIEVARSRGSRTVIMNSGPQMLAAHALYTKLGFRRLTEREGPLEVEPGRWIDLLTFGIDV